MCYQLEHVLCADLSLSYGQILVRRMCSVQNIISVQHLEGGVYVAFRAYSMCRINNDVSCVVL